MEPYTLADPEDPFRLAPFAPSFYDSVACRLREQGYPLVTAETVRAIHARLIRECCLRAGPPGPEEYPAASCPHAARRPVGACAACAGVLLQACRG